MEKYCVKSVGTMCKVLTVQGYVFLSPKIGFQVTVQMSSAWTGTR